MSTFISASILLVLLLGGCASESVAPTAPATTASGLSTDERLRITDRVIQADQRVFSELQKRMAALNSSGVPARDYHLSKANAWIDFAVEEYSDNDRSGIVEAALDQALTLIRGLEAGEKKLPMVTPIIPGSRRVREDLWLKIEQYKSQSGFACAADRVARLEVQLVWAGHEEVEGGWRHAKPYLEIAEDLADQASEAFRLCVKSTVMAADTSSVAAQAKATSTAVAPNPSPVPASDTTAAPTPMNLATDTLFRFNGAARSDILPTGITELDALIERIKRMGPIRRILITGHSDRLGDSAYNLALSIGRANTLRQLFIERGFAADLVQSAGAGESEPLVTCSGDRAAPVVIDCLQPNRRVEVRVSAASSAATPLETR